MEPSSAAAAAAAAGRRRAFAGTPSHFTKPPFVAHWSQVVCVLDLGRYEVTPLNSLNECRLVCDVVAGEHRISVAKLPHRQGILSCWQLTNVVGGIVAGKPIDCHSRVFMICCNSQSM